MEIRGANSPSYPIATNSVASCRGYREPSTTSPFESQRHNLFSYSDERGHPSPPLDSTKADSYNPTWEDVMTKKTKPTKFSESIQRPKPKGSKPPHPKAKPIKED